MTAPNTTPAKRSASPLWGIVASVVFVAALLTMLVYFDIHHAIIDLLYWVDARGIWGPVLVILLMALVVVLVLPGILLTTGAGFVFGVVEGSIYIVLGTTLGALAAFLISRYLFGPYAADFVRRRNKLRLVNEEMSANGWKIVLLTRLIPFFPGKLSNYFFGLTRFSWQGYLVGSLIGFIPFSVHNVYLGSIAADVTNLGLRNPERSGFEWFLYGGGFVVTVAIVFYLNRLARRALSQYTESADNEESLS
ncbi:TVP38/TMEM64 family protein [Saccharospirillum impatiens]|uniref:TVP38/TMEM64 family protein n=1 Tax=Saccharospirillum impatiens TaxID=169438 RepID=UPI0003FF4C49|nr:TVP38/TMEM64 family protein [Saccharospirillum impatiens]